MKLKKGLRGFNTHIYTLAFKLYLKDLALSIRYQSHKFVFENLILGAELYLWLWIFSLHCITLQCLFLICNQGSYYVCMCVCLHVLHDCDCESQHKKVGLWQKKREINFVHLTINFSIFAVIIVFHWCFVQ